MEKIVEREMECDGKKHTNAHRHRNPDRYITQPVSYANTREKNTKKNINTPKPGPSPSTPSPPPP